MKKRPGLDHFFKQKTSQMALQLAPTNISTLCNDCGDTAIAMAEGLR